MNTRVSLSLSMIVRNEERFLGGCIESVKHLVEEICIVDTGSTDATVSIAHECSAKVSSFAWTGDFSEARNYALSQCTGAWVLYLDADERFAPGQDELLRALTSDQSVMAYNVRVRSGVSLPGGRAVQVMSYPRLFRRTPTARFEGAVHEQIAPSIIRAGGKIAPSLLLIHHLGYDQGFDILKGKAERNLQPLLQQVALRPDDWYARLQTAKTLMLLQDSQHARMQLQAALECVSVPPQMAASMHNLLAESAFKENDIDEAMAHSRSSLELEPDQAGVRWFLAGGHIRKGNLREAIGVLAELLSLLDVRGRATVGSGVEDILVPEDTVLLTLGKCQAELQETGAAARSFLKALHISPTSADALSLLLKVCGQESQPELAIGHLEEAAAILPGNSRVMLALASQLRRAGRHPAAWAMIDEVHQLNPVNEQAWLQSVGWRVEDGDSAGALEILAAAEARGITSDDLARCGFEVAFRAGQYTYALKRLDMLTHLVPRDTLNALRDKLIRLAAAAGQ